MQITGPDRSSPVERSPSCPLKTSIARGLSIAISLVSKPVEQREGALRYYCSVGEFHLFRSSGAASGTSTQLGFEWRTSKRPSRSCVNVASCSTSSMRPASKWSTASSRSTITTRAEAPGSAEPGFETVRATCWPSARRQADGHRLWAATRGQRASRRLVAPAAFLAHARVVDAAFEHGRGRTVAETPRPARGPAGDGPPAALRRGPARGRDAVRTRPGGVGSGHPELTFSDM